MSGSSDAALLRRLVEFELSLKRDSSETVEEFDWGRLLLNPQTRAVWSDNYLELESPALDAAELVALADDLLGARGLGHRLVVPADPAVGARLEPGFRELAWAIQRSVYMVLARKPDREGGEAREVPRETIEGVRHAVAAADPDFTAEAVDQRPVRDARLDRFGNGRWFAAPATGSFGAACVLYERDGIGQVETVVTSPERRGQGLATAVVLSAVAASRAAGHELTFVVADDDDWPWKLYERLGFDRVGVAMTFLRKPDQDASGA